jgi:hypothetical protein
MSSTNLQNLIRKWLRIDEDNKVRNVTMTDFVKMAFMILTIPTFNAQHFTFSILIGIENDRCNFRS